MGKPYSEDLRVRVVEAAQDGATIPESACILSSSHAAERGEVVFLFSYDVAFWHSWTICCAATARLQLARTLRAGYRPGGSASWGLAASGGRRLLKADRR
jgi:hypothetical protein